MTSTQVLSKYKGRTAAVRASHHRDSSVRQGDARIGFGNDRVIPFGDLAQKDFGVRLA